jgi:hypothetical protein
MTSTAPPTVLIVEQYIQIFPIKTLTRLSGSNPPKHEIVLLKRECLANLSSIFSTLPSCPMSWTKFLQTDAEFLQLHGTAWIAPTEPIYPNHTQWVPTHIVSQDLRQYNTKIRQYMEQVNIRDTIFLHMLEATPKNLVAALEEPIFAFKRRMSLQIYTHLANKYNKITSTEIRENDTAMKATFDPST